MTTVNNIAGLQGLIGKNPMQANAIATQGGGLAAFLSVLLSQSSDVTAIQELQGLGNDVQQISEKIADILNLNPADSAKLEALLSTPENKDIRASLTSDLTTALSVALQAEPTEEIGNADIDSLAALLNDIQPGTSLDTDIADINVITDTNVQIKNDLIAQISTLTTAEEIASFLTEKGFTQKDIDQVLKIALPIVQNENLAQDDIQIALATTLDDQAADLFSPLFLSENPASSQPLATVQHKTPTHKNAVPTPTSSLPPPSEESPTATARGSLSQDSSMTEELSRYQQSKENPQNKLDSVVQKLASQLNAAQTTNSIQTTTARGQAQTSAASATFAQMFGQSGGGGNGFSGGGQDFLNQQATQTFADTQTGAHVAQISTPQAFSHYMAPHMAANPRTTQMVAVQMHKNMQAKIDTFTMQLEPADLGRLDIKMTFKEDGSVKAHLVAERPETLSMLQKDAAHLERLLQEAGLDTRRDSLSFDLQQSPQHDLYQSNGDGQKNNRTMLNRNTITNDNAMDLQMAVQTSGYISQSGVNIMV